MIGGEVARVKEEEDAAAGLAANALALLTDRAGEEQPRALPVTRRHHHPTLAGAHVRILHDPEAEGVPVKGDRFVVVADEKAHEGEAFGHGWVLGGIGTAIGAGASASAQAAARGRAMLALAGC